MPCDERHVRASRQAREHGRAERAHRCAHGVIIGVGLRTLLFAPQATVEVHAIAGGGEEDSKISCGSWRDWQWTQPHEHDMVTRIAGASPNGAPIWLGARDRARETVWMDSKLRHGRAAALLRARPDVLPRGCYNVNGEGSCSVSGCVCPRWQESRGFVAV